MIKVHCDIYDNVDEPEYKSHYAIKKSRWEHVVNAVYKAGGHAGKSICPVCRYRTLKFDFEGEE